MSDWISVATGLTGLLAGGAVTYLANRAQLRIEAEHAYDRALRDIRLPHYQQLFRLTRAMPREWLEETLPSRLELTAMRETFRDWYFSEGASGMFLSQGSRDQYFLLIDALETARAGLTGDTDVLSPEGARRVRRKASDLRHQLSADLGVAERPRGRWTTPRSVPAPYRQGPQERSSGQP
jgi:hypothetical protein